MTTTAFTAAADATAFTLGGNARVTLVSLKTGARYTFRVAVPSDNKPTEETEVDPKGLFFVSLLNGSDNESDYAYLGTIRAGRFAHGVKSKIGADAPSAKAFAWAWAKLMSGVMPEGLEVYHEGRCGRCNRPLTVPESIRTGFGPECAGRRARLLCEAA